MDGEEGMERRGWRGGDGEEGMERKGWRGGDGDLVEGGRLKGNRSAYEGL